MDAVAADALDLTVLEGTQQLRLQLERELANLVEKERAAVRNLELAGAIARGSGKGASDVPEELTLGDGDRQGRAVHMNQRFVPAQRRHRGSDAPPAPCRRPSLR